MNNKNIFLYITLLILAIFTIAYFIIANNISHSFSYDTSEIKYANEIKYLEASAKLYAKKNNSIFKEKEVTYIKVSDLVKSGIIQADDEEGNVKDPSSDVKVLNDTKIRLTNKNGKIQAKVLEN